MSHSLLDSASHVLAGMFLLYRVEQAPLHLEVKTILEESRGEHQMYVCGSLAAAVANLEDTWREATGSERDHLKQGYDFISENLEYWRSQGLLPSKARCQGLNENVQPDRGFRTETYRIDGGDNPRRRVNWAYRVTHSRGI